MTVPVRPICAGCLRRPLSGPYKCEAYPEGIPQAIIFSKVDHRKPYEGDGGKQFAARREQDADWADVLFDGMPIQEFMKKHVDG